MRDTPFLHLSAKELLVDVAAVADGKHLYDQKIIQNGVDDPEGADTEPITVLKAGHRPDVAAFGQAVDCAEQTFLLGLRLLVEEFHRRLVNDDAILHRDTPSCRAASSMGIGWPLSGSASYS